MTNNDFFRNFLHLTGLSMNKDLLIKIFELGGTPVTHFLIERLTCLPHNRWYSKMYDEELQAFFDGLFKYKKLKTEQGVDIFYEFYKGKL